MAQRPEYHIKTGLTATVKEHCTVRVTDMVSCNEKNEHTPKDFPLYSVSQQHVGHHQ